MLLMVHRVGRLYPRHLLRWRWRRLVPLAQLVQTGTPRITNAVLCQLSYSGARALK